MKRRMSRKLILILYKNFPSCSVHSHTLFYFSYDCQQPGNFSIVISVLPGHNLKIMLCNSSLESSFTSDKVIFYPPMLFPSTTLFIFFPASTWAGIIWIYFLFLYNRLLYRYFEIIIQIIIKICLLQ